MGLYSFRRSGLSVFSSLKPKEKEIKEKVEMYRLLENGFTVRMIEVKDDSISVDTIEDLLQIRKVFYESKNNN